MSKSKELEIKNKYTGEVIDTIPADTPETLQASEIIERNGLF
ncbi:MAG: hypothetical protein ACTSP6_11560 [Promethearchaeota archaeon]